MIYWLKYPCMKAEHSGWNSIFPSNVFKSTLSAKNNLWSGQTFSDKSQQSTVKSMCDDIVSLLQVLQDVCGFWKCLMFCAMNCGGSLRVHFRSCQYANHWRAGSSSCCLGSPYVVCFNFFVRKASFPPHVAIIAIRDFAFSSSLSACDHICLATQLEKWQEADHMWTFETHTGRRGTEA